MKTFDLKENQCPSCGDLQDAATRYDGTRAPKPGDVGLCLVCLEPSIYVNAAGLRRKPTSEEAAWIANDPRLSAHLQAMREGLKQIPRRGPIRQ